MNSKRSLLKLTILLSFFGLMADVAITPAMESIFASFPNAKPYLHNMFLTGPMFTCCLGTLICGVLARHISKYTLLIMSYILFIIGAAGGALIDSFIYMVSMRLVAGFAYGAISSATLGLIAELFAEEAERSFMMGGLNSASAAIGIVMSFIGRVSC